MSKFIGRQQEVGIARETSRGSLVTPTFWIPKTNFSVEDKVEKSSFNGNYGVLAGGDDAIVTRRWSEGDLEMEVTDDNIGLLLYALFGSLSSASFNSAYKHTITEQNSTQPTTLSLMMNDPIGSTNSKTVAYARGMVNSLELTAEVGELLMASFGFVAMPHTDYTLQTPSYTAENKFSHRDVSVYIASNEASLSGASKINVRSLSLTIEKNVEREHSLGTVQPVDILARSLKISGSLSLTYEDRTYRDFMNNGTKKALRILVNRSDVTIGSTTPQIQIDLPIVHFDGWEATHPLEEVATQDFTFTALYDVSNSYIIGANTFVVNETASY